MTKALRHMNEQARKAAVSRRLDANTGGLGFWAAKDAVQREAKRAEEAKESAK